MVNLSGWLALFLLQGISSPEWHFEASSRWRETLERDYRFSGTELSSEIVASLPIDSKFTAQLGLQTLSSEHKINSKYLSIDHAASLSLHRAYLEFKNSFLNIRLGRQPAKVFLPPSLYNTELPLNGASEEFQIQFNEWTFGSMAEQIALFQNGRTFESSAPISRKWQWNEQIFVSYERPDFFGRLSISHLHISSLPARMIRASALNGNSFSGSIENPELLNHFSLNNFEALFSGQPLGIPAQIQSSMTFNWASNDIHRSYFVEGKMGEKYKTGSLQIKFSYYYSEPDVMTASLSNPRSAHTNREGFLVSLSYGFLANLVAQMNYLYSRTVVKSPYQDARKEFIAELEYLF